MTQKFVFHFSEGNASQKDLLGGKGANLAEMVGLGIPVPDGFTISTLACTEFYKQGEKLCNKITEEIFLYLNHLEKKSGKGFGDAHNPLLVSVRSGAKFSMPGMMDTVLNLGLNFDTVKGLEEKSQNPRFAWDCFRRFIQMYSNVVLGVSHALFEEILYLHKKNVQKKNDTDITADEWKKIVFQYLELIKKETGKDFPMNPKNQLLAAITAVFASWNSDRAIIYRNINHIPHNLGTAVNIQMMVFGNLGENSGTGVAFTRDPSTGENIFYGEFLMNAQGEDVVAGIRTPKKIEEMNHILPESFTELCHLRIKLEKHFREMQDIEFTIEEKKLYMLQTRTGKRSAEAALNIAVDMVQEGLLTKEEALLRVTEKDIETLLHPRLDVQEKKKAHFLTKGLPASPGGASGKILFCPEKAVEAKKHEEKVILVRHETSPEDIAGMYAAEGVLTACGGMTSHAAVVARGMGKPCVCGAGELEIDEKRGTLCLDNICLKEGDIITLDGSTGEVFEGKIHKIHPKMTENFNTFLNWADEVKTLEIRTNADTPKDTERAIEFGAEGIGLCRTEHMFFKKERIFEIRKMILTEDKKEREKTLKNLQVFQEKDFEEIFYILQNRPLTVRLIDPPLHEFLPTTSIEIQDLAKELKKTPQEIRERIESLHEVNPMLGHRGCRLLITMEGLLEMQVTALFSAAQKTGGNLEIMIPLVSTFKEFTYLKSRIEKVKECFSHIPVKIGTMIETPRACIEAEKIAYEADFFSFGTNDLTQMTFGFSRDDIGKFLPKYLEKEILEKDPFQHIDRDGVGKLVQNAIKGIKKAGKNFKTSVCGEHGGDGESIDFFYTIGLTTVSCSPFRVPVARLAAAQSVLKSKK